jgi:hypothetical protein
MCLTERVYNAFILLLDVLEAADPLSTVTHGTDSRGPVWALESWNEKVPCLRENAENRWVGITGEDE